MISIIIPAYNSARTIEKCLASIFSQTFRNFQVVVVDDGSTDATGARLQVLGGRWPLRVVTQENRGAQAARNRGWREINPSPVLRTSSPARRGVVNFPSPRGRGEGEGNFVLFCDADIVMKPDMLEKMVRALDEHPETSYAYSSFKFGWKTFKLWPFSAPRLRKMPYIHTTALIRAKHFPGAGWDETVPRLQDWDLWLTMLEQGHTGIWIPEVLFQVISTKGTMSQWLPSFAYKIPKWLGVQPRSVMRYNEAVGRIRAKHHLL